MTIDYQNLLDQAMLDIVKKILFQVEKTGLDENQSFYISFQTDHKDVVLSKIVKQRYPKEITIVLQYQFKDLHVSDDKFTVNIAFGGFPETIVVPFMALTNFVDPTANFTLQFKRMKKVKKIAPLKEAALKKMPEFFPKKDTKITKEKKLGEVISINKFQKKYDK